MDVTNIPLSICFDGEKINSGFRQIVIDKDSKQDRIYNLLLISLHLSLAKLFPILSLSLSLSLSLYIYIYIYIYIL